ncbi:hypothetical protein [Serratia fonticola]|jgi:hypothetical protein|nr:hypothetical protein [Serratia fonticola]
MTRNISMPFVGAINPRGPKKRTGLPFNARIEIAVTRWMFKP